MWYFAWILGLGLAVAFGVLNGVWHEFRLFDEGDQGLSEPEDEAMDLDPAGTRWPASVAVPRGEPLGTPPD